MLWITHAKRGVAKRLHMQKEELQKDYTCKKRSCKKITHAKRRVAKRLHMQKEELQEELLMTNSPLLLQYFPSYMTLLHLDGEGRK